MQEGSGLRSGASLRRTDSGVRPYVIFGGFIIGAELRSAGRTRASVPTWFLVVLHSGAELCSAGRTGRPSLRDSKACRVHLLFNRQIQVVNL